MKFCYSSKCDVISAMSLQQIKLLFHLHCFDNDFIVTITMLFLLCVDPLDQLKGLQPVCEDWHAKKSLMEVSIKYPTYCDIKIVGNMD